MERRTGLNKPLAYVKRRRREDFKELVLMTSKLKLIGSIYNLKTKIIRHNI
jgi:hypothetical protein